MSDDIAEDQIAAFVDRILRLKAEADDIAADIKEIYAEAHGNGFNKTRLGEIVTYLRKVEKDASKVEEAETTRDLYLEAYYRAKNKPHAHAHAREPKAAPAVTTQNISVPAGFDPETGEEVTTGLTEPASAHDDAPANTKSVPKSTEASQEHAQTATGVGTSGDNLGSGSRSIATAKTDVPSDQSQASGDGQSQDNSGVRVASVDTPLYADPGSIVMETVPPVGIVAHPFAACWPVNQIDVSGGVEKPVVKIGNLILDGRGRFFAARAVDGGKGMEYPVVQYDGDDALADSIRWNIASRTMSEAALRMVAQKLAKAAPDRADEILERMGLSEERQAAE